MPRFMGFVRMEEGVGTPPKELFEAMDTYIAGQAEKGVFLDGGGLYGTEDAVNFVVRKGEVSRVDGPYAEAKEVVGGIFVVRAANYDEAIRLASDCPHLAFGRIDVRQIDFMGRPEP